MPDTVNVRPCSLYLSGRAWKDKGEKFVLEAVSSLVSDGEWVSDPSFSGSKEKKKNPSELCSGCRILSPHSLLCSPPPTSTRKILEEISSHSWAFGSCCVPRMSLTPPAVRLTERHKSHGLFPYDSTKVFPLMSPMAGLPEVPCG